MGITKTEEFDEKTLRIAQLAKVLGHPARVAIVNFMIQNPDCICNDIVGKLPLAQSTVSKHLSELKTAGIIQGEISGNSLCYCINPKTWEEVKSLFNEVFDSYEGCGTNCC